MLSAIADTWEVELPSHIESGSRSRFYRGKIDFRDASSFLVLYRINHGCREVRHSMKFFIFIVCIKIVIKRGHPLLKVAIYSDNKFHAIFIAWTAKKWRKTDFCTKLTIIAGNYASVLTKPV